VKQINPNIYPKDGYFFRESDGSKHVATSWEGVVKRVTRYRERQGRPVGSVHDEVVFQACHRNPSLCVDDNGTYRVKLQEASLKSRVLRWLSKLREIKKEGFRFVDQALHDARVDVCYRCPLNKNLPEGCSSCRAALNVLREELVGSRKTDSRVTACPILGEYLPVSTWIDLPAVGNESLTRECWRKKTL